MKSRNLYDLSNFIMSAGKIGRLLTLDRYDVVPGDTFDINISGVFRLAPLRRNLTVDAKIDLFGFYIPHRHIYGQKWIDFILEGHDNLQTFAHIDNVGLNAAGRTGIADCYGTRRQGGSLPAYIVTGYNQIWNRYFRHPTADGDIIEDETPITGPGEDVAQYGLACGHLPSLWSTTIDPNVSVEDFTVASGQSFTLMALDHQKGIFKTERTREWFGRRYTDVLRQVYRSGVNTDADQRPTLLKRSSFWMSGYDVDATDTGSLGNYSGKAAVVNGIRIPPRFYPEHGQIWIMALVRFPPIHEDEVNYLETVESPSYDAWACDPDRVSRLPPISLDARNIFSDVNKVAAIDLGTIPYAQWYRYHPNRVHHRYDQVDGFPFYSDNDMTKAKCRYIDSNIYDRVFKTDVLGHWNCQLRGAVSVKRWLPGPGTSIFAGTR